MFRTLKTQWRDVTQVKPGRRFQNRYYARKGRRCSRWIKPFYLMLGAALLVTGIILMPAPGPGVLVAFIGAGMLAEESLLAARALDAAELKIRAAMNSALRLWKRASAAIKALVAVGVASVAALAGWVTYTVLFA
jgi:uncharacterized protein (TIGR02611 family)